MKKVYVKPELSGEQFLADEYVSACWVGECNISGYVFHDYNKNGLIDWGDSYIYKNNDCDHKFIVKTDSDEKPAMNALIFSRSEVDETIGGYYVEWNHLDDGTPVYWGEGSHVTTSLRKHSKRPNHS